MRKGVAGRRRVVILMVAAAMLVVVSVVTVLFVSRGRQLDGALDAELSDVADPEPVESPDTRHSRDSPEGQDFQDDPPDESPLPPIVTATITDDTTRDLLWLWTTDHTAPPRSTLDNSIIADGLSDETRPEVQLFEALIDEDPDRILSYLVREVRSYLGRELRSEMEPWRRPRNVVLLSSRDEQVLRFGIFSDGGAAAELILYLEGNLIIDGELVTRDWSRRNSLSTTTGTGSSGPLSY